MRRHDATAKLPTVGRHKGDDSHIPAEVTDPPRPRVRNDGYNGAITLLAAALYANVFVLLAFLGMFIWTFMALGADKIPGFLIVCFAIWAFRRKGSK